LTTYSEKKKQFSPACSKRTNAKSNIRLYVLCILISLGLCWNVPYKHKIEKNCTRIIISNPDPPPCTCSR